MEKDYAVKLVSSSASKLFLDIDALEEKPMKEQMSKVADVINSAAHLIVTIIQVAKAF